MSEFGCMLEQEIPRLRRYARALTRDSVQADDLVQSTLVRALAKRHLWQPGTNLRHWLFTLLHNQRISDVRRLIRDQRACVDDRLISIAPASPDPDARIALLELDRAIAALPEARRQVVLLIGLEEMSYGEAAEILGVPAGTIRSRLARARASRASLCVQRPRVRKPSRRRVGVRDMSASPRNPRGGQGQDRGRQSPAGASTSSTAIRVSLAAALSIVLGPAVNSAADLVAGELLADKWCAQCHGVRGDRLGPNLSAPTFPELAVEPSITEYSLRALLQSPHETMPHIKFTPDQLDDIVGYIISLKARH